MNTQQRSLKSIFVTLVLFGVMAGQCFPTLAARKHPARRSPERAAQHSRSVRAVQRSLPKGKRAAEMRRRRAEAARMAAIARQRARDDAMRNEAQLMIDRDNTKGEDPEVRRAAVTALGNHAGTVVVMDPKTGRVYSIVNQEWALRRGFKPCSTIKLVTGLAGLNEKVIDPGNTTNISDSNRIDLTDALAYSNNTYFQQVGGRVGFDKMVSYARSLGLGEKTGINAPNEFPGQMPAPRSGYAVNHMSSHGDDFKVTAVQLATLVSALANGGKLLAPNVPRTAQDAATFRPKVRRLVDFDVDSLRYMVPGMVGSVNYGSGRRAHDPLETVAGKTGTCIESGTWVGLFASYAPLVNPRLAVVVIARGADAHSHFPATVAGRIYRELNGRFGTPTNLQIAGTLAGAPGNNGSASDPKAALNEEDRDENADDNQALDDATVRRTARSTTSSANVLETTLSVASPGKPQPLSRNTNSAANSNVRRVLMQIPRRTEERKSQTVVTKPASKVSPQIQTRPRRANNLQR